ncbi:MAG: putative bifunctional diguanylate cyclase/phosphodiesterase [Caulobacteraceae bacterium]
MRSAPFFPNEDARLKALSGYGLLPGDGQVEVGSLLELASSLFNVPIVLLSLVERHRQIFAAKIGLDVCETDRSISFCAHALDREDALYVPDATLDPRFFDNPLVLGEPHIRFYAGHPLRDPTGQTIGTLCLIDPRPRSSFTVADRRNLKSLADLILAKLELRRLGLAKEEGQTRFEQISATSPDGIICADHEGRITFWNAAAERLFGFSSQEVQGRSIDIIVPDRMRSGHAGGLRRVANGGEPRLVGTTVELPAKHKDGSEFKIELSLSMWREGASMSFGSIIRDISERRANEDHLYRLAHLDPLTELPNRMVLRRRLEDVAKGVLAAAVIIVDLDGFKEVNDTLGHSAGDALLQDVAARLLSCVRPLDTVARLGGDEFALLLPETGDPLAAAAIADCAIAAMSEPFEVGGEKVTIGASAGLAMFPNDGVHAEDLLSNADLALYQAKAEGRHCRRFFTPTLRSAAVAKRAQEVELQRAVEQNELELFYQPQVRASDGALVGAEALLRWRHPQHGILSPAAFLPTLEGSRHAARVGDWVIRTGCAQAAHWRSLGASQLRMGVNLFGVQFRTGDLAATVRDALQEAGLPGSGLELEITENIILRHEETMIGPLRELRDEGVGIAFDDYGTGYASLSLLKRYPLTRLKIDQSFVRDMCDDEEDAAIVRAVIMLGQSFGLDIIAEGVETEAQRDMLVEEGASELQGYLFGRPMTAPDFEAAFDLGVPISSALGVV